MNEKLSQIQLMFLVWLTENLGHVVLVCDRGKDRQFKNYISKIIQKIQAKMHFSRTSVNISKYGL